jgi:probable rRNA maturation factor
MRKLVENIFDVLGFQTQEVSITFASDRFVRRLNKKYRGFDRPTDVLAFAMREGEWTEIQPQLLGDVVISVDTAKKQALDLGHSLNKELAILLIHGILHLVGYDHMQPLEAKKMQAVEKKILKHIGTI